MLALSATLVQPDRLDLPVIPDPQGLRATLAPLVQRAILVRPAQQVRPVIPDPQDPQVILVQLVQPAPLAIQGRQVPRGLQGLRDQQHPLRRRRLLTTPPDLMILLPNLTSFWQICVRQVFSAANEFKKQGRESPFLLFIAAT